MDINRLPKWAQRHIRDLSRERDDALRQLNELLDCETESPFYTQDILPSSRGNLSVKRYIQTNSVTVEDGGVTLEVLLPGGIQGRQGIELRWQSEANKEVGILPVASNCLTLKAVQRGDQ